MVASQVIVLFLAITSQRLKQLNHVNLIVDCMLKRNVKLYMRCFFLFSEQLHHSKLLTILECNLRFSFAYTICHTVESQIDSVVGRNVSIILFC